MATDKKEYIDTLAALATKGSLATIINKLRKISISTEDNVLRKQLAPALTALEDAHRNQGAQKINGLQLNSPLYRPVIQYCEQCVRDAKPQWQILAEQHGWRAPPY